MDVCMRSGFAWHPFMHHGFMQRAFQHSGFVRRSSVLVLGPHGGYPSIRMCNPRSFRGRLSVPGFV